MADNDDAFYRLFCAEWAARPTGKIVCEKCYRDKGSSVKPRQTPNAVKEHFKLTHKNIALDFSCSTCYQRFKSLGEKQKHELYVHEKKAGWWKETEDN